MPVLKNARHERFAQLVVEGETLTAAYQKAGFAPSGKNAERLRKNEGVAARILELNERAADKAVVTKERVLIELAKIGFANMDDYIRRTDDGEVYVNLAGITRDQAAAIGELTVDTYTERDPDGDESDRRAVKRIRFKLLDKRAALVDLGKHLGMFRDASDDAKVVVYLSDTPTTPEEWAKKHGGVIIDDDGTRH